MGTEFKLPELGENIESGDLVRLMIKPGGSIAAGEPVMELETDKAVVEVPSSVTGTVGEIRVKEGDKLKVGQVIFTIENGSGAASPASKTTATPAAAPTANPVSPEKIPAAAPKQSVPAQPTPAEPRADRRAKPTAAAPSEFKMPELGENIDSGDLVRLMITVGATVSEGQPVMELETDKAVVEVPSTVSGVVREIKVKEGQKVKVGDVIFTLEGGVVAATAPASKHQPVEHVDGQEGARVAFQLAMRAEGKSEDQALPPDQPQAVTSTFSMPAQTRQSCRHGASRSSRRRSACAPPGARDRCRHSQRERQRTRRTHQ